MAAQVNEIAIVEPPRPALQWPAYDPYATEERVLKGCLAFGLITLSGLVVTWTVLALAG